MKKTDSRDNVIDKFDFSKGSIVNHMINLAIPMILAQMVNVLYNIVDRIYIGRIAIDSTNALTGVGVAFPLCTLAIAFGNLVGTGGAPLFSMTRGRRDDKEARMIMGNSLTLIIIFGVIYSIAGMLFKNKALYLLGASAATFDYANSYISIYLVGSIFVMLSLGLNSFINAQGFAKIGMFTVSIGAICNIILDPIFIFTLNMGVRGAALATVISQFLAAVWTILFLTGNTTIIKLSYKSMRLNADRVKEILALGLTGFTMQVTNSLVQMVYNSSLSLHGGDVYIAAMTIINSVREIFQMFVQGVSNGAQPIMSYNYGAGKTKRVKETIKIFASILIVFTTGMWIIVMVYAKYFVLLFNDDAMLLKVAIRSMHIYFFGFFMMTGQFVGQTTFTALGKAKSAVFFSIFRKVVIVIPLIMILPYIGGLGVDGVVAAEPISNFVGGMACIITMYFTVYCKLE